MITLSNTIKAQLEGLGAPVYYFYPQSWARLPVISWRESGNREFAQADGREHLAELIYAIDIWSDSPEVNQSLTDALERRMMALRLRRDYLTDLFDARAGLHHRSLRYRCVADGAGRIYQ